ncbi:MAG TPA: hypothetical protein PLB89_00395 [Flavobacteriales bacterium]|nr:hypothetical protein [Flavobacteriales bacterium]
MKAPWIIALFAAVTSCGTSEPSTRPNAHPGIVIQTEGPRGGGFTDANGESFGYGIFRVHVKNDTTVPAELTMDLPGGAHELLPDSIVKITAFLFPDAMVPATARDTFNFGISGAEDFVKSMPTEPSSLKRTIQPGEEQLVYFGVIFDPDGQHGYGRAQLFIDGQRPDTTFFPAAAIPALKDHGAELELLFGVAFNPPKHYAMIPCGRIAYKK